MSTRQSKAKNVVAPNNSEEEDMGVLIYREIQLRKAEAAAIAAESKKKSTVSAATRTSTRKRTVVNRDDNTTKRTTTRNGSPKRKGWKVGRDGERRRICTAE